MTKKDLKTINDLKERFDNLPNVVELRIEDEWRKLTNAEYELLQGTYKKLDDILNELRAFIAVKLNNREDLIRHWNSIDFDPGFGSIKIKTNDRQAIKSAWISGMSQLNSLFKIVISEVILMVKDEKEKRKLSFYDLSFKSFTWQKVVGIATIIGVIIALLALVF